MSKVCLVVVDVRSTYNVGSLLRTADGFSADVILIGITPRPIGGKSDDRLPHIAKKAHTAISKTALGAEDSVDWKFFIDIKSAYEHLRSKNYKIAAIEQSDASISIQSLPTNDNIALIVGSEVEGLSQQILDKCDAIYEIPMSGRKESFNVSVAAAIALYQACGKMSV